MAADQLAEIMHRAEVDDAFSQQLFDDFEKGLKDNGYSLSSQDIATLKARFSGNCEQPAAPRAAAPAGQQPASAVDTIVDSIKAQQVQNNLRAQAQSDRLNDLGSYTVQIFKDTLTNSSRTYRTVTVMNAVMFWMGVVLFLFAAFYGAFTHNSMVTIAFGGLGAASFVALFFLGPIEKTQAALSSLIQAEIAFMSYYEQITFAENYAMLPPPGSGRPTHENIAYASEMLQLRSKETIELLQIYVGNTQSKANEEQAKLAAARAEQAAATLNNPAKTPA